MKEKAIFYCQSGENCSLALLKAASDTYHFPLSPEMISSCGAVTAGFGIGGICATLVAAIQILGILFPAEEAKRRRLFFLLEFREKFSALDCPTLSAGKENCTELIGEIAALLQSHIEAD